jgi:hypothetical protein
VPKRLIATIALTALAAFRLARFGLGTLGLWHEFGLAWAIAGAAALLLLRFTLPIRLGAFLGAISILGWPWYAAVIVAMTRMLLMLPGLVSYALARLRHPPAAWHGVRAA